MLDIYNQPFKLIYIDLSWFKLGVCLVYIINRLSWYKLIETDSKVVRLYMLSIWPSAAEIHSLGTEPSPSYPGRVYLDPLSMPERPT